MTIDGVDIKYLSMHYLLVPETKEIAEITIGFGTNEEEGLLRTTIENVPLQRNYRTNIYGNFLTEEVDFSITIDPEYTTPDYNEEYDIPISKQ